MANSRYTKSNPEKMNNLKMEAATEVGVTLKPYNGDLTSKQAGSIGGSMTRKMVEAYVGKQS